MIFWHFSCAFLGRTDPQAMHSNMTSLHNESTPYFKGFVRAL
ncbi:hypothetical protein STRDD11_00001 [Streptococcus sp. DD11]|nr:hypothetical protein STRDD11_00001 [Streptococcus sp. DD11]